MIDIPLYADIIILGLAISALGVLGAVVFFSDYHSATHRAFLLFSIAASAWGAVNYAAYQASTESSSLWLWRLVIFTALWFCFGMFRLAYVFPERIFPRQTLWYSAFVVPFTMLVSLLTLTPLVFARLTSSPTPGAIPSIENGPLIPLFGLTVAALVIGAVYRFWRSSGRADGQLRKPIRLIMIGTGLTFALLIIFNFIFPVLFQEFSLIPFGAAFILPFALCTAFAIGRYQLFNARLVAAEAFSFTLVIATLIQILFSSSLFELIFRVSSFVLVLALVILFVRSVIQEIAQRELIQKQEQELEVVNTQQVRLLHFISHEVKGYFTKAQGAFAGIATGDYGDSCEPVQQLAATALTEMRKGSDMVMDILEASNLKKGTVEFRKKSFDFKQAALEVTDELRKDAEARGLTLQTVFAPSGAFMVEGDEEKVRKHVIRNLIENSIHYTPNGSIKVSVARRGVSIRFVVEDTGIGITQDDMKNLFTEGGHGKESQKINVDSTGYGLFIAKQITEAHGGSIHAESEGPGKGSRFIVDLPGAALPVQAG